MTPLSEEIIKKLTKEKDAQVLAEVLDFYEYIKQKKLNAIEKQDTDTQRRIVEAIYKLPQGDVKKVKASSSVTYRLRVGDIRILFQKNESELIIIIIDINNRSQVYK